MQCNNGRFAVAVYRAASLIFRSDGRMEMVLCMFLAIAAAVAVYLLSVVKTKCITNDDLKLIPGGEKVGRFLHMQ